jgi:enoyl-CoA hydratase/carnithine racemase
MPLARIGLLVPFALGQKLVEILGPAHTRHLLFTGRLIDARRAYEIGMVNQLVSAAEIEKVTYDLARQIAENAPQSLAGMKLAITRMISQREQIPHEDIDALARQAHRSEDAKEGAAAMLEKRKPVFKGR